MSSRRQALLVRARGRASGLPLRVRLVAGFAVAITVVLSLAGAFVYWRVTYALDLRLDNDLRSDAAAVAPVLRAGGTLGPADAGRTPAARRYQVLDATGRVTAFGTDVGPAPLLGGQQLARARRQPVTVNIGALLPASRRPLRLLAEPLGAGAAGQVLVVADRRDQRDEALRELLGQLTAAGLAALAVTAFVGDRLARAALRPVERYRTQAVGIAAGASGVRLDVPAGRDDEVTRLGHTLNDVLDALEHALVRERQFTQDASHELRTPLALLSTRVQIARRRTRTVPEHERVLQELERDITALSALSEQLLQLTTATSGPSGPVRSTDLRVVVQDVLAAHTGPDAPQQVPVTTPGPEPVLVSLPEPVLRQVLLNLLGNAGLHGTPPVTVTLTIPPEHGPGGWAQVGVHDTGKDLDPVFLATAAERFTRSDVARSLPGAGLGLALVREVVQTYGGELRLCTGGQHHRYTDVASVPCAHPDAGTSATVLLPLATISPTPAAG